MSRRRRRRKRRLRRRKGGGGGRRTEVLEDYNINVEFVFMHVFK